MSARDLDLRDPDDCIRVLAAMAPRKVADKETFTLALTTLGLALLEAGKISVLPGAEPREVIARALHEQDHNLGGVGAADWRDCPRSEVHAETAMVIADALGLPVGEAVAPT